MSKETSSTQGSSNNDEKLNLPKDTTEGNTLLHIAAQYGKIEDLKSLLKGGADVNKVNIKGRTPLHHAAKYGQIEVMEFLLSNDVADFLTAGSVVNVNQTDKEGATLLHLAAANGQQEVMEHLLEECGTERKEYGANVNQIDSYGETPLHYAAFEGKKDIIEFLLSKYPDVDVMKKCHKGFTPLNLAAQNGQTEAMESLLANGVKINGVDIDGNPLHDDTYGNNLWHTAAIAKLPDAVMTFLRKKNCEGINQINKYYETPLHYAASNGKEQAMESLLANGVNINGLGDDRVPRVDVDGSNLWHVAARGGHLKVMEFLLEKQYKGSINQENENEETPLHLAVKKGKTGTIKFLLENGVDINGVDINGVDINGVDINGAEDYETPLHFAARVGNLDVVKFLLEECGADINKKDFNGATPLHHAARDGHLDVVEFLIKERGADIDAVNKDNFTLLHYAAEKGQKDVMEFLIKECGSGINQKTLGKQTPLLVAAQNGQTEAMELLLANGVKINGVDSDGHPLHVDTYGNNLWHVSSLGGHSNVMELLFEKGGEGINQKTSKGSTPLLVAAQTGQIKTMKFLLANNDVGINQVDSNGALIHVDELDSNLCHVAARGGYLDVVEFLLRNKYIDFRKVNKDGENSLHFAACGGHLDVVEFLLEEHGADINGSGRSGMTPLHFAAQAGYRETVELLLANGADVSKVNGHGITPFKNSLTKYQTVSIELLSNQPLSEEDKLAKTLLKEKLARTLLAFARNKNFDPGNADISFISPILDLAISALGNNTDIIVECRNGASLQLIKHLAKGKEISDINKGLIDSFREDMEGIFEGSKEEETRVVNETPLSAAAIAGNSHIVKYLLDLDDDPKILIKQGNSSILYGVCEEIKWINDDLKSNKDNSNQNGKAELGQNDLTQNEINNLKRSLNDYLEIAEILIEKGADIQDKELIKHLATIRSYGNDTKTIKEHQKDITDERNKSGETPYTILSSVDKENFNKFRDLNIALLGEDQNRQKEMNAEQNKVNAQLSEELSGAKAENAELKTDLADLKAGFAKMQESLSQLLNNQLPEVSNKRKAVEMGDENQVPEESKASNIGAASQVPEASNKRTAGEMDGQGGHDEEGSQKKPKTVATITGQVKATALKVTQKGLGATQLK